MPNCHRQASKSSQETHGSLSPFARFRNHETLHEPPLPQSFSSHLIHHLTKLKVDSRSLSRGLRFGPVTGVDTGVDTSADQQ
ncbi:hypothetical protein FNV43_RR17030 [Rhamnella rubrinervis]|uniref:Uncharacterized protein n=1 Tax=Rhamnella rubrinervis TaxID=2594499 RepID=A0A8K0GZX3_9ROSA|nr:hypothetical protein FNV43_RR17030 [Rhamnella rubrinervis]